MHMPELAKKTALRTHRYRPEKLHYAAWRCVERVAFCSDTFVTGRILGIRIYKKYKKNLKVLPIEKIDTKIK